MIYSYFTEKYLKYAKIFLESYSHFNDKSELIYLDSIGVSESDIEELYLLYPRLIVNRHSILDILNSLEINEIDYNNYELLSSMGKKCILWKNYVADEDRVKKFRKATLLYPDETHYTFLDIDLLFRDNIVNYIRKCDTIHIRIRPKAKLYFKVAIGFIIFPNKNINIVDEWIEEIDAMSLTTRKRAHGQFSFYKIYENNRDIINNLDLGYLDSHMRPTSKVWTPNKGLRESKYNLFIEELKRSCK